MNKLIASLSITPDGFCNHADVIADEENHLFAINLMKESGILLFGRNTYELFESYWPNAARDSSLPKPVLELAQRIDQIEKVVVSKKLTSTQWSKTQILDTLDPASIIKLKQRTDKNILVFGSPLLLSGLASYGLVDEFYFSIQPLMAGKGKRLFENLHPSHVHDLKLIHQQTFQSGVVTLHYQKANG